MQLKPSETSPKLKISSVVGCTVHGGFSCARRLHAILGEIILTFSKCGHSASEIKTSCSELGSGSNRMPESVYASIFSSRTNSVCSDVTNTVSPDGANRNRVFGTCGGSGTRTATAPAPNGAFYAPTFQGATKKKERKEPKVII